MRAVKNLPANYHPEKMLDFSSLRSAIWLNVAAVPLLFVYGWIFQRLIILIRSINHSASGTWGVIPAFSTLELVVLIVSIFFMLTLHEMIHGAFFWLFTRERPKFALKPGYAYAAAPDWHLPRPQYVVVGISPFIVISVLSILLSAFVAAPLVPYFFYMAIFNAAGALGDMIVVGWVLRQSAEILVQDHGDKFLTFAPDND